MPVVSMEPSMVPEVTRMARNLLGETAWKEQDLLAELSRSYVRIYVYKRANRIGGFLHAHLVCETASIQNMAVDPDSRRQGVGTQLLQRLEMDLPADKKTEILLEVRASNQAAQAFYRAFGFFKVGTRKNFYKSPGEDAIVMRWERSEKGDKKGW